DVLGAAPGHRQHHHLGRLGRFDDRGRAGPCLLDELDHLRFPQIPDPEHHLVPRLGEAAPQGAPDAACSDDCDFHDSCPSLSTGGYTGSSCRSRAPACIGCRSAKLLFIRLRSIRPSTLARLTENETGIWKNLMARQSGSDTAETIVDGQYGVDRPAPAPERIGA